MHGIDTYGCRFYLFSYSTSLARGRFPSSSWGIRHGRVSEGKFNQSFDQLGVSYPCTFVLDCRGRKQGPLQQHGDECERAYSCLHFKV
jgi:hypothetical protein